MAIPTIADLDPWLEPYRPALEDQRTHITQEAKRLLASKSVEAFALGHLYFGMHRTKDSWLIREWAPNARDVYLVSPLTSWNDDSTYRFTKRRHGVWELRLPLETITHGLPYKLHAYWDDGDGYRIPAYASYVVQDSTTHNYDAVVWAPERPYEWTYKSPLKPAVPIIYEAHVGMSDEKPEVASYRFFADTILPRIAKLGYNTVQLMAIQEHPYYGSFGYHVSSFFAPSSRFGSPEDLKYLIDTAHKLGLYIILDIVHSHAVKNELEGLSRFDGTTTQYFHAGDKGTHQAWDSRVFDYGKPEVAHFLLSNLRFWLDEYHFDGFRFDGVTSMLYHDHGLERSFGSYDDYVSENIDIDALTYLTMANKLIHSIRPDALTIAEDMSAFPGIAAPIPVGGIGFDYRLSMGVPDLWIKLLKEKRDEDWDLGNLLYELQSHRPEERTISYAESHDQALVGDKTLMFRLIDKAMYDHMQIDDPNLIVERGIALHKMIRLVTATTHHGGYLNFMGNEFGHPEWIDFPREGNAWSYHHARRQWSLADNARLKYRFLQAFDTAFVNLLPDLSSDISYLTIDQDRRLVSYSRGDYLFVYNFSPEASYVDQAIPAPPGAYDLILSSDDASYGGQDRVSADGPYQAVDEILLAYIPARVCLVFKRDI